MTNPTPRPPGPDEFLEAWRRMASDTEQRWNDFFNQVMGTEAYAQLMARSMDGFLAMQSAFARSMEQYLRALNLPTRTDITQLGERIGMLEQRLDMLALTAGGGPAAESSEGSRRTAGSSTRGRRSRGGGGRGRKSESQRSE